MSADPWHAGSPPTCYRHPDRETRLACSSCGRPTCVECVQSAGVGRVCHDCAAPRQPHRPAGRGKGGLSEKARAAPVSSAILAVTVAIWVLGFVAPELGRLLLQLGVQANRDVAEGDWYRLLSAAFLHGGPLHLFLNMLALYLFGPPLEREAGSVPFAVLYAAAALAGGAAFFLMDPGAPAVGASGAIFGLLGVWLAASVRNRGSPAGQAFLRNLLLLLGINFALPFLPGAGQGIAWQAHLGGLIGGFVIAAGWLAVRTNPQAAMLRTVIAAAVGLVALLLVGL